MVHAVMENTFILSLITPCFVQRKLAVAFYAKEKLFETGEHQFCCKVTQTVVYWSGKITTHWKKHIIFYETLMPVVDNVPTNLGNMSLSGCS